VDDAGLVRELDLERFADAAQAWRARPAGENVDLEHEVGRELPAEALEPLLEDAIAHAQAGHPLPMLLLTEGRTYRTGNFREYIGQFTDLLPVIADGSRPGMLTRAAQWSSFARQHNLVIAALLTDPLIASHFPRAARLLGTAKSAGVPLLAFEPRPVAPRDPAQRPIVTVTHAADRLIIQGLACLPGAAAAFADPDSDPE
jgi:hypothetical protein